MKITKKRLLAFFCAALMLCPLLVSCGNETAEQAESSKGSKPEEELKTVYIGDKEFTTKAPINTDGSENGAYIFTREAGASAPKCENNEFFDIAVLDGMVVDIYEKGKCAVIPEDGFVLRLRGEGIDGISIGDEAELSDEKLVSYPESYLKFGDVYIEIGYKNAERTAEDTGWLYDEYWYNGNTESNIYCTEISICDGKIVEINPSGDDTAGISIRKGGYVLVVGQGSVNEYKAKKLSVGDEAVLCEGEKLYTSKRLSVTGSNTARVDDGILLFTSEKTTTTPVGRHLTEVLVDKNGKITEIYTDCTGMKKVPKGGFIVSASGANAGTLARAAKKNALVFKNGPRSIHIVTTPQSELDTLTAELDALKQEFDSSVESLARIDYSAVNEDIVAASATLENASKAMESGDGEALAKSILALYEPIKEIKRGLLPYVTVQDRMAWVTIGEYDYNRNVVLHYRSQSDIDHTVNYARLCGLNTLIIDNMLCGFAVYESEVEGMVKYRGLGELDVIAGFKKACDENNIRLIVMVNAFSSGMEGVAYPSNHYMTIYKDKYLLTNKGRVAGPDGYITLDPADEEIQEFNLAVVKEIAERYDVFGIQADYMRYPLPYYYQEHNYEDFGYNESSKAGFIKKYGKDPAKLKISDPLWEKWCAFRRDIISDYQARFYNTVKAVNPELHVSFTCFADYRDRQIYTYQDVEKWAENGTADAIFPMIYGDTTEYQLKYALEIAPAADNAQIVLGVGTYVRATQESIGEQLIMPYDLCYEGVSVFTVRYICTCGYGDTFNDAFRFSATPTTASDKELIAASKEMLNSRINSLIFASEYSSTFSENAKSVLNGYAETLKTLGAEGDFARFCNRLSALCDTVQADESRLSKALLAEIEYIISLS